MSFLAADTQPCVLIRVFNVHMIFLTIKQEWIYVTHVQVYCMRSDKKYIHIASMI